MEDLTKSHIHAAFRTTMRKYISQFIRKFVCSKCHEQMNSSRRIATCGHSVCEVCLDLNAKTCPVCKECFDLAEVEEDNVANKFMCKMLQVKQILDEDEDETLGQSKHLELRMFAGNTLATTVTNININDPMPVEASNDHGCSEATHKGNKTFYYQNINFSITFINGSGPKKNAKGETPLHNACKKRDTGKVIELITQGVDLNAKDFAGWVPLHEAIQVGAEDIVRILIEKGALINTPGPEYTTPLHMAYSKGHISIIRYLVSRGADRDAIDYNGKKPEDLNRNESVANAIQDVKYCAESLPIHNICIYTKVVAYCHSVDRSFVQKLSQKQNKLIRMIKAFNITDSSLTHVVVKPSHHISCKILLAIAAGVFIVPQEWIDNWLKGDFHLPLDNKIPIISETVATKGIKRSMVNKLLGRPKLFDGLKFYISDHKSDIKIDNLTINKAFLEVLIKAGGGEVLNRPPASRIVDHLHYPYHCFMHVDLQHCTNIIIFEENHPPALQYHMPELKHRTSHWLINAVICHNLGDTSPENDDITLM